MMNAQKNNVSNKTLLHLFCIVGAQLTPHFRSKLLSHFRRKADVPLRNTPAVANAYVVALVITWLCVTIAPGAFAAQRVYWTDTSNNTVNSAGLDGTDIQTHVTNAEGVAGLALDPANEMLYCTYRTTYVGRANLSGTSNGFVYVQNAGTSLWCVDLDTINGQLYWANYNASRIETMNVDGSGYSSVLSVGNPVAIAVNATAGTGYCSSFIDDQLFQFSLSDGSVSAAIPADNSRGIALDVAAGKVYWTVHSTIYRANLDFSGQETVLSSGSTKFGIAMGPDGRVYWSEAGKVRRANLDGSNVEDVVTGLSASIYEVEVLSVPPMWVSTTGGSWDEPTNWTAGFAPSSAEDVAIEPDNGLVVNGTSDFTTINSLTVGAQTNGVAELALQSDLYTINGLTVQNRGQVTLSGQTLDAGTGLTIDGTGSVVGFGLIHGDVGGTTGVTGIQSSGGNYNHTGSLDLGTDDATVLSLNFANLGTRTTLGGGTIHAPGGLFLQGASSLEGNGTANGKIAAAFGSTIIADGSLSLGDADVYDGFASDGVLLTGNNSVTIYDKNEVVLGSLTKLGDAVGDGTLIAANGLLVEFGKNVTGHGTINTPDDSTKPLVNNGMILGDSPTAQIVLTGYVKGVGKFDNFSYSGTFSPGLSPIELTIGSMSMTSGATLLLEIGGTTRGGDYDALVGDQAVVLDGTLEVVLIDDFAPEMGHSFDLFDLSAATGEFDDVLLPEIGPGLQWDDSELATAGVLLVTTNGDIDRDDDVDGVDLQLLLSDIDTPPSTLDQANLEALLGNFGRTDMSAGNPVPEPSTALLVLFGLMAMVPFARRK